MEFDLASSIDVLRRTPAVLRALLSGLPEPWVRGDEGPDTFSPFDVVGHLIDGEETDWIPRARIILGRGPDPRFAPYDRFRHRTRNAGRSLGSLLEEFARLRAANLELLRSWNLTPAELDLPGIHPTLGQVTLRQLLATWVVHDLGHLAQVSRVMAKQYREAVGPWVAFLPVLTDREPPRSGGGDAAGSR
ncbi:MAG TPA: DinB family protein [Gemmatimonadales bacterium]|nr:DinB family protein [Gemmatimonadales bacterium]